MHISDKLKSSVGLTLTVLLIGSIAGNYIESQKPRVTTITYADLVERTTVPYTESDSTPSEIATESDEESVAEAPFDITAAGESDSASSDLSTQSKDESIAAETQSDIAMARGRESLITEASSDVTIKNESESTLPATQSAAETTASVIVVTPDGVQDADEANRLMVYVSSTGKYHKKCDCSGMKNYTEMTMQQAIDAGHIACKRCW